MSTVCQTYPVGLPLEDIVPIILGGTGLYFLAQRAGLSVPQVRVPAIIGVILVSLQAALSGPLRKITIHIESDTCSSHFDWMRWTLFPSLALGFALISWAVYCALRGRLAKPWLSVALLAVAAAGSAATGTTKPFLFTSALFAIATGTFALVLARRQHEILAAWLYGLYIVGTATLPPLAQRINSENTAGQWAEQLTNTVVQAACLVASYLLLRSARSVGTQHIETSVEAPR